MALKVDEKTPPFPAHIEPPDLQPQQGEGKSIFSGRPVFGVRFSRWIREERKKGKHKPAKRGRSRTREEIRALILKLGRDNEWGYTRNY